MKNTSFIFIFMLFISSNICSQTAIQTSFETDEGYTSGNIAGTNNWSGNGTLTAEPAYIKTGLQSLRLSSTASSLQTDHIAYAKDKTGLINDVYLDLWLNIQSLNGEFTVTTYDLTPNSSSKRGAMFAFTSAGQIKIYSGSSGSNEQAYTKNDWIRISARIDYSAGTYQLAINGNLIDKTFNFRESYTPESLGRPSGQKEFHSLRFSNGTATNDIAVDDLYIGTNPIADVNFGSPNLSRTISIAQPANATITLLPQKDTYDLDETVTASIAVDNHYIFSGWTGDLSGTDNPASFTVTKNMAIGANITIDQSNPPASYSVTLNQPTEGGQIIIEPIQSSYYEGTQIKLIATTNIGYEFRGWSGDLTGNENPKTITIRNNLTVGADIIEKTETGTIKEVNTVSQLKTALTAMIPGDEIVVADGNYNLGGMSLKNLGGTNSKPVIVRAANLGKASLTGKTYFTLTGCENIIFQGFKFDLEHVSTIFKLEGSSFIRITQNEFRMASTDSQSSKWIIIGEIWENEICRSKYNRIDHNLFEGKYDSGAWVVIDGSHGTIPEISKYDRIDHNHFRFCQPRVVNEKETIRVGVSDLSMKSAFCTVEYNLFEECDGDPEVVSIKSCDNIIRGNTFRKSLGTLSLRHGVRNRAEGNYFFGDGKTDEEGNGCGGLRVYGIDHVIVNNYFEGLTGSKWDAAITLTNGDVTNSSSSLTSHFLPENVIVAFNTLVNNESDIEIGFDNGGKYGKSPKNCLIAHNIIINDKNQIVKSYSQASLSGVRFENNRMYPTGTSSIGINYTDNQIKIEDPKLVKTNGRTPEQMNIITPFATYKLSADSPCRNAATGSIDYLTTDSEGQPRSGIFDLGADEYSPNSPILTGVIGAEQSGVNGTLEGYENGANNLYNPLMDGKEISISPNPASDILTIHTASEIKTASITAVTGEELIRETTKMLNISSLISGVYLLCVIFEDGKTYQTKFIKL